MIEELVKNDSNFNEGMFKSYADNIFVKLFTAIMIDDLDSVRHFLSDDLYQKYKSLIDDLKRRGITQIYDELNVKNSEIYDVEITDEKYRIVYKIISRYMDYEIDIDTGNLVCGDNTRRIEKIYYLTFEKISQFKKQNNIRRCPGCGASIDVNGNGKCEYCGTAYDLKNYDYILINIVGE